MFGWREKTTYIDKIRLKKTMPNYASTERDKKSESTLNECISFSGLLVGMKSDAVFLLAFRPCSHLKAKTGDGVAVFPTK